jgi:hypothetical protein
VVAAVADLARAELWGYRVGEEWMASDTSCGEQEAIPLPFSVSAESKELTENHWLAWVADASRGS